MAMRKILNYWFSKRRENFYIVLAVLCAAVWAASWLMERNELSPALALIPPRLRIASYIGAIVLCIAVFIHININSLHEFMDLFNGTDHFPLKQISLVNSFCMTIFLIIAVIAAIVLSFALSPIWPAIAAWFYGILHSREVLPPEVTEEEAAPQAMTGMMDVSALTAEQGPPPAWLDVAEALIGIIAVAAIAVFIVFMIRYIFKAVWRFITRPRNFDDDEKIYLKPTFSLKNDNVPEKTDESPLHSLFSRSYDVRIRRLYKDTIRKKGKTPPAWAAPGEIEEASGIKDRTLHELYEKARYGSSSCTQEDWNILKNSREQR